MVKFLFGVNYDQSNFDITIYETNKSLINNSTMTYTNSNASYKFTYFVYFIRNMSCTNAADYFVLGSQQCCSSCPSPTILNSRVCIYCNQTDPSDPRYCG